MSMRDALDDFNLTFRAPSSKVTTDRNALSKCDYDPCKEQEHPRLPKFSVCASCRRRRYCSREHQAASWSTHKTECGTIQEYDLNAGIYASIGVLTQTQIVQNLLEDYSRLHESTYHQMVNNMYHREYDKLAADDVDLSRLTARISLKYNPDWDDNPAHAFSFEDLRIVEEDPLLKDPEIQRHIPPVLKRARYWLNTNRKNDPTFIEVLPCNYYVTDYKCPPAPWNVISANRSHYVGIYKPEAPFKVHPAWFDLLCKILAAGIVLRKVNVLEEKHAIWMPGTLKVRGEKWVWFPIPPKTEGMLPFCLPPVEHWARTYTIGTLFSNTDSDTPMELREETWQEV
ncbi:hypothetical protein HYPSUDRAFT_92500 [Hypholoma sublateritium FD-334 SS-4]|uniref:MYND-type domain-containing protein n=1 Tax=Hypholoma sublateritium (strain FD-334 SS-4) TaxID=945553 RepID=A0A0D2P0F0_HYPSF|nr:hypothetical protein HYPSUDRAFT_92500 [Hypholoma sublateritium FD-334 SS-4]